MPNQSAIRKITRSEKAPDLGSARHALMTRQFNREKAGARTKKSKRAIPSHGHDPRLNAPGWSNMAGDEGGVPDSGAADSYHDSPQSGAADDYDQENEDRINNQMPGGNLNMPETGSGKSGNMEGEGSDGKAQEPERVDGQEDAVDKAKELSERKKASLKERAKQKLEDKVMAPARAATGAALKWAWLTVVPSWGLSLIYINTHVFLRFIFPDAFCKLGEEWVPKVVTAGGESTAKNVAGTAFGIVEIMALLFLDLLFLLVIIAVLGFLYMIIHWMTHPIEAIWDGIKALTSLFVGYFTGTK